ncbi:uncharacterized protein LOC124817793 [Hydra vulgaris]|uniref:uncharacterized protein LOC124817793 n=1 Tax=Hydra vulgaris TaxID=6087 RepID=UPI001F5E7842|nr:uncharacterized protein LOC124817793 [Hydra vulgaris]
MTKMPRGNEKKYLQFLELYKKAYSTLEKQKQYQQALELWKIVKNNESLYEKKINELKEKVTKSKVSLMSFWGNTISPPSKKKKDIHPAPSSLNETRSFLNATTTEPARIEINLTDNKKERENPAQVRSRKKISDLESQRASLIVVHDSGLSTVTKEQINTVKETIRKEKTKLDRLIRESARQRKRRQKLKESIETVCQNIPEASSALKQFSRNHTGRPRLEVDQPELLSTIIKIVQNLSAADERQRTECLRSVSTLDDLQEELTKIGFTLSRSGLYLRLLPRRGNTSEGKKHVSTVPVKLLRPENSMRKKNDDRMFAKSFIDDMFEVCKLFGPKAVLFISNDDKARVSLGIAAASLQAPLLMHMEYKVKLMDHDFVVSSQHKLIPSVYGVCEVNNTGNVSYSGDTFIRIRSAKHDTSNAFTHAFDVRELFKTELVKRRPIMLMETDGAQDEAPRFPKTLATAVDLFRLLNLDALLHGVNAAGLSAFNPVERRMAPLSRDLAGIVLPHDFFGNHLDSSGKTIDYELEVENFQKAADVLSQVWEKTVIDGYPVHCQAVPVGKAYEPPIPDPVWVDKHCQQSRYSLQIVKCQEESCCTPFETNWLKNFPQRFIPFPAIYEYCENGYKAMEPSRYLKTYQNNQRLLHDIPIEGLKYKIIPFDLYRPSLKEKLSNGICDKCNKYWPSEAAMKRHKKAHTQKKNTVEMESEDSVSDSESINKSEDISEEIDYKSVEAEFMPVFDNIFDLFKSPFEEI